MHAMSYGLCEEPAGQGCDQTPDHCGFLPDHNISIWSSPDLSSGSWEYVGNAVSAFIFFCLYYSFLKNNFFIELDICRRSTTWCCIPTSPCIQSKYQTASLNNSCIFLLLYVCPPILLLLSPGMYYGGTMITMVTF
jgi:hypothetical protein